MIKRSVVPHIDQYFGVWAIHSDYASDLVGRYESLAAKGIEAHLQSEPYKQAVLQGQQQANVETLERNPDIAVFSLEGPLMKHVSSFSGGTSTIQARREVRQARADADIKGGLLLVDSPGGTFAGMNDLAADLAAFANDKPLFALIEDMGASAAFFAASQARKVFSNESGMVGSIGTYIAVEDSSEAAEMAGVKVRLIRTGAFKGIGVAGVPISEDEIGEVQRIADEVNEFFVNAVARGRGMSRAAVDALADGRVHIGQAAADLNLTDGVRTFDQVVSELREAVDSGRSFTQTATEKEPKMSETTNEPKAATIQELKSAFPKAEPLFLVDQMEKGATLQDATTAYAANLEAQLEIRNTEVEELKSKQTTETPGVKPLETNNDTPEYVDPRAEARRRIEEKTKTGMNRAAAVRKVYADDPALREAIVNAAN